MTNFEPCAAEVMRRFAKASGGEWIEVGGGVAGFCGADSPVNAAKGMENNVGRAELQRVFEFFADHGKDAVVELAPWVIESCKPDLDSLGFNLAASEDLMVRRSYPFTDQADEVSNSEDWARVLSLAFFGEVCEMGLNIGKLMFGGDMGLCLGIRRNGELVACGQILNLCGAGLLAGDGTLPEWRNKGLQQQLIAARVRRAYDDQLEWVHSEVAPGSGSQRNYQRAGFSVLYSRTHFVKPFN